MLLGINVCIWKTLTGVSNVRRRALDLVYALVNESNIKTLTSELLDYLKVADAEFKPDLTAKVCLLVQRFAPDKRWHFDSLLRVSGNWFFIRDRTGRYVSNLDPSLCMQPWKKLVVGQVQRLWCG